MNWVGEVDYYVRISKQCEDEDSKFTRTSVCFNAFDFCFNAFELWFNFRPVQTKH